jgi:sporulation protein YlmC with PRC-barrel domain
VQPQPTGSNVITINRSPFFEEPKMNQSLVKSLMGMKIVGQHGREIGVIADMSVDVESWQLQTLEVKLNRQTLDDLKLNRPWFGSQTVHVPVSEISGATDNLVLKSILEEMEFSGGAPAEAQTSTDGAADTSME